MKNNTTLQICDNYRAKQSYLTYRKQKIKFSIYKKLTRQALPLFTKGGDIISIPPLANGIYEPEITNLINHFASENFTDFLIDVGANIGLTSCQCGGRFQEVHMFEPNPDCVSILKVNAKIALRNKSYNINEFGLGSKKETLQLYVPYDNWGGAFIKSTDNEYNQDLLSEKDGYGNFNEDNYQILDVHVESAIDTFTKLFCGLLERGKSKGVIKIDVEGYETLVLNAIAKTIPDNFQIFVIFENWDSNMTIPKLEINPKSKADFYKLSENKSTFGFAPRWFNSLFNFIKGGFILDLKKVHQNLSAGTFILTIQPIST